METLQFKYTGQDSGKPLKDTDLVKRNTFEQAVLEKYAADMDFIIADGGYCEVTVSESGSRFIGEIKGGKVIKEAVEEGFDHELDMKIMTPKRRTGRA